MLLKAGKQGINKGQKLQKKREETIGTDLIITFEADNDVVSVSVTSVTWKTKLNV